MQIRNLRQSISNKNKQKANTQAKATSPTNQSPGPGRTKTFQQVRPLPLFPTHAQCLWECSPAITIHISMLAGFGEWEWGWPTDGKRTERAIRGSFSKTPKGFSASNAIYIYFCYPSLCECYHAIIIPRYQAPNDRRISARSGNEPKGQAEETSQSPRRPKAQQQVWFFGSAFVYHFLRAC